MNNSKTTFRILAFLVLFIPTYIAIYHIYIIMSDKPTPENTAKVAAVRTMDNKSFEYTENNDIKIFTKTLEDAESIKTSNRDLNSENPIIITFYKGADEIVYSLYLSRSNKECLLKSEKNELMLLNPKDADILLSMPISDTIYEHNQVPLANIPQGQEDSIIYPNEDYVWYLKKPDGNFYPTSVGNIITRADQANKARVSQNKPFNIQFNVPPDSINFDVYDNKELVYQGISSDFEKSYYSDANKMLQFVVTAEWSQNDDYSYYGRASYTIDVSYEVPPIFMLSKATAEPGDVVIFTGYNISDSANYSIEISNDEGDIIYSSKFVNSDGKKIALFPVSSDFAGKTVSVSVIGSDEPIIYQIPVSSPAVPIAAISAQDDKVTANLSASALATKQSKYDEIFKSNTNENQKYWDGKFLNPREGKIWIAYGSKVTINGGHGYINKGINLDVELADPILASNSGKVVFAGSIPDDGNLVVIDHGMGIRTWYAHLADINVKEGDTVTKGQDVGTAGMTGMYTSIRANLYFALSVNNIFVNPMSVIKDGISAADLPDSSDSGDIPSAAPDATDTAVMPEITDTSISGN